MMLALTGWGWSGFLASAGVSLAVGRGSPGGPNPAPVAEPVAVWRAP
jgi:hypothetical protein